MDPVSAMATATAAFSVLKKGFAIGRDIESMASDLSRWMGALSDLDQAEKEARHPPVFKKLFAGKTVEQEAIEVFAAKNKAQKQREELKQFIQFTMGQSHWDSLVRMEGQIRKQRAETLYRQRERRRKFMEIVAYIVAGLIAISLFVGFVMLLKSHAAKAEVQLVTCRLAGGEVHGKDKVCVYLGANQTLKVEHFMVGQMVPTEYKCEYSPDSERPPTVKDIMDAIKEAMN